MLIVKQTTDSFPANLDSLEGFSHKTATAVEGHHWGTWNPHCQPWQLAQEDFPSTLFAGWILLHGSDLVWWTERSHARISNGARISIMQSWALCLTKLNATPWFPLLNFTECEGAWCPDFKAFTVFKQPSWYLSDWLEHGFLWRWSILMT